MTEKQQWLSCLYGWYRQKKLEGLTWKEGIVACKYREKFGVWPKGLSKTPKHPTPEVLNWLNSQNKKFAKSQAKVNN